MDTTIRQIAGTDYPKSRREFEDWFNSEEKCIQYIAGIRWPNGFQCPACGAIDGNSLPTMSKGLYLCRQSKCKRQTSVTAGTLFHKSQKPLSVWFVALWVIAKNWRIVRAKPKRGLSALYLMKTLKLGSYNTAWEWFHKLRRGMVRIGRDKLEDIVEVDVAYLGGVESRIKGPNAEKKAMVAIAAEVKGNWPDRIRMAVIPDVSEKTLQKFVLDNVNTGAIVRTNGWKGYNGLERQGYRHKKDKKSLAVENLPHKILLPRVKQVVTRFDHMWLGTYEGAIRPSHLAYYLDEFTFHFNHRKLKDPGLLFYRLIEQAVDCGPLSRKVLVGGKDHRELSKDAG